MLDIRLFKKFILSLRRPEDPDIISETQAIDLITDDFLTIYSKTNARRHRKAGHVVYWVPSWNCWMWAEKH